MDEERRRVREKRYRNRIRIGLVLTGLFLAVTIAGWVINGVVLVVSSFFIPVGLAYLLAGLWEKRELNRKKRG